MDKQKMAQKKDAKFLSAFCAGLKRYGIPKQIYVDSGSKQECHKQAKPGTNFIN